MATSLSPSSTLFHHVNTAPIIDISPVLVMYPSSASLCLPLPPVSPPSPSLSPSLSPSHSPSLSSHSPSHFLPFSIYTSLNHLRTRKTTWKKTEKTEETEETKKRGNRGNLGNRGNRGNRDKRIRMKKLYSIH